MQDDKHASLVLLKRDESGAVGGTNTWPTVLDGLVGQRELAQIETNHFWLNFDLSDINENIPMLV